MRPVTAEEWKSLYMARTPVKAPEVHSERKEARLVDFGWMMSACSLRADQSSVALGAGLD